jgi:hypothetical protein
MAAAGAVLMGAGAAGAGFGTGTIGGSAVLDAATAYSSAAIFSLVYIFFIGATLAAFAGQERPGLYFISVAAAGLVFLLVIWVAEIMGDSLRPGWRAAGMATLVLMLLVGFIWTAVVIGQRDKERCEKKRLARLQDRREKRT